MNSQLGRAGNRLRGSQKGAASVEAALMFGSLVLILGAIIDFGHYFYMLQVLNNASQEGARYGSVYTAAPITSEQISSHIIGKYGSLVGNLAVNATGAGGAANSNLTVSVSAAKTWFFLEIIIKRLSSSQRLHNPTAVAVVRIE
jgi:Flp pilus assembly protein TadG